MHPLQDAIVERLRPERDPIDTGVTPGRCTLGLHIFRIGLQRHFNGVTRRREEERDRLGRQKRWRAAAEVEGVQAAFFGLPGLAPGVSCPKEFQFLQYRVHILPRRDALAHRDGEVAVGAAALAEGDMQVEVLHGWNYSVVEYR